jgi:ABC-type amino acid transport substrate-binding protein
VKLRTWLVIVLLTFPGCDLPRDASDTLQKVRGGHLRVGLIENPPWANDSSGRPVGVEVQLVTRAAADLNSRLVWIRGTESDLLESLHARELDLVVGGMERKSPWHKKVAFSRPYYVDSLLLVSTASEEPTNYKGRSVAVDPGGQAAIYVRKKGAIPVPLSDLSQAGGMIAAPVWKLATMGHTSGGTLLHTQQRAMAVAPGENAWLSWLERWLLQHQSSVPAMLRAQSE